MSYRCTSERRRKRKNFVGELPSVVGSIKTSSASFRASSEIQKQYKNRKILPGKERIKEKNAQRPPMIDVLQVYLSRASRAKRRGRLVAGENGGEIACAQPDSCRRRRIKTPSAPKRCRGDLLMAVRAEGLNPARF
jgi:hypothetical protein